MTGGGIERVLRITSAALTGGPRVGALSQEPPAARGETIASLLSLVARAAWPPSLLRNAVRVGIH